LGQPARAEAVARYFKTGKGEYGAGDRFLGISVPDLRRLSATYRDMPLRQVSALLSSPWHEARLLALFILVRQYGRGTATHRDAIHALYLRQLRYVNNWDLVDSSATSIVGPHLRGRDRQRLLTRLAQSSSVWKRRAAVLATFHDIKNGTFAEPLRIARLLIDDPHDLIHKAVGWMLREVGKRDQGIEEEFLRRHAATMPRTMLRYAIERFPERLRRQYLLAGR
jgi:3-methyladenine DNA glycosylase AlkD